MADIVTTSDAQRYVTEAASPHREPRPDSLTWSVSAIAAAAWVVFMGVSMAVQPPPADPSEVLSTSAVLVSLTFHIALLTAVVGLGMRRRYGLWASVAGGAIMMGASVMCYLGGHTGAWVAVQLASGVGLAAASAALIRFS